MLFNSTEFAILFAIVAILYYLPFLRRWQASILLISSFVFYAHHNPPLLALLLFSVLCNAVGSYAVLRHPMKKARWVALVAVSVNIGILAAFKYAGLLALTFWGQSAEDYGLVQFLMTIPLPLGISFFTFQGISLVIDCFRARQSEKLVSSMESLVHIHSQGFWKFSFDTALYIAFFPQLIAGPIVKARDFYFQIQPKAFSDIRWDKVFRYVTLGYFLKMVIADNLKDFTYYLYFPLFLAIDWMTLLALLLGYSAQIFADFAGYSAIAIGLSAFFGYEIPVNFRKPYGAQSFADFWSRWHISLSTWLKEYLYIGLGGNRNGAFRTYLNLFLVMFLGGLWHGASWNYALWGMCHGLALAVERAFQGSRPKDSNHFITATLRRVLVFAFVTHAWLFFIMRDLSHYMAFWKALATNSTPPNLVWITFVALYCAPVFLYHTKDWLWKKMATEHVKIIEPAIYGAMIWLIVFNSGSAGEFIYFQF